MKKLLMNALAPSLSIGFIICLSALLHAEKFSGSFKTGIVHTLLLSLFLFGLFGYLIKNRIARSIVGSIFAIHLFMQLAYDSSLSVSALMSVLNSSPAESASFIYSNFSVFIISILLTIAIILLRLPEKKYLYGLFLLVGSTYILAPLLREDTSGFFDELHRQVSNAMDLNESYEKFDYYLERASGRLPPLKSIQGGIHSAVFMSQNEETRSSWTNVTSTDSPELLVIGIGESLRAENLGIYGYKRETTPQLRSLQNQLTIYQNAFSAGTNTWNSVPASLTKVNGRADLSKSIINLAKDAGYQVLWLSNQTQYSLWDFSVTSIANQANYTYFSANDSDEIYYDSVIIDELEKVLKIPTPNKKRLIILNFYGSHSIFSDRYPEHYSHFNGTDQLIDEYDNSVLYTDALQSKLISLISQYGGKYLFYADHGLGSPDGDVPLMHDVRATPDIDSLKVPLFTYPKEDLGFSNTDLISLFYFECIFSAWSGINATELDQGYCADKLKPKKISYIDSNLLLNEVSAPIK
jgi:glucan phosphoethanolaminetransferase (alkaline phosphatase superfamily)